MIETRTLFSEIKLDLTDLRLILLKLSEDDWKPAILESYRTFLQFLNLEEEISKPIRRRSAERSLFKSYDGDVFFNEIDLYYLLIHREKEGDTKYRVSERNFLTLGSDWIDIPDQNTHEEGLQIGIVSPTSHNLDERLSEFSLSVEKAVISLWNEQGTDPQNFDWQEVKPGTPHLDKIISSVGEKAGPVFQRAELAPEECTAAQILTSKLARETLIEISQAGFAREQDILSKKGKAKDEVLNALAALKQSGLLNIHYLLECKKNGTSLTQLQNPRQLKDDGVKKLLCPFCGESFSQENLAERYSLSDLGHKMIRKSHWMTVWVTEHLVKLGIPQESILWDIVEASEEVDLLVEFLDQFWVFELKDKEFASNHAHALSFRQVRYHADKAFIITTERVSKDAKTVFEELGRERKRIEAINTPIYIEGLQCVEDALREQVSRIEVRYAIGRLKLIGDLSGYDIASLYFARLKKYSESALSKKDTEAIQETIVV